VQDSPRMNDEEMPTVEKAVRQVIESLKELQIENTLLKAKLAAKEEEIRILQGDVRMISFMKTGEFDERPRSWRDWS
jgi:hypothetical protein